MDSELLRAPRNSKRCQKVLILEEISARALKSMFVVFVFSLILFDANGQALSFDDPLLVSRAVELELKFGKTKSDQDGEGAVRSHYVTE